MLHNTQVTYVYTNPEARVQGLNLAFWDWVIQINLNQILFV